MAETPMEGITEAVMVVAGKLLKSSREQPGQGAQSAETEKPTKS